MKKFEKLYNLVAKFEKSINKYAQNNSKNYSIAKDIKYDLDGFNDTLEDLLLDVHIKDEDNQIYYDYIKEKFLKELKILSNIDYISDNIELKLLGIKDVINKLFSMIEKYDLIALKQLPKPSFMQNKSFNKPSNKSLSATEYSLKANSLMMQGKSIVYRLKQLDPDKLEDHNEIYRLSIDLSQLMGKVRDAAEENVIYKSEDWYKKQELMKLYEDMHIQWFNKIKPILHI